MVGYAINGSAFACSGYCGQAFRRRLREKQLRAIAAVFDFSFFSPFGLSQMTTSVVANNNLCNLHSV